MDRFKSCPFCNEQLDQCFSCASYVVDGERIYYEKLKDFGATQDHELRFINRIQKHRTTAFFHNGKLYIPSRQGRSVPLAIGLQWEAWQEQQAEINRLEEWNSNQARSIKTYQSEDKDLKALLQKLIDDEYTTMRPSMAYEIQKALRGERE